ncbi:MAG: RNA polymerase-binding protein DksA [Thermodesulfobacteriota bacterium]
MFTKKKKEYFTELLTQRLDELLAEDNKTVNDINGPSENRPDPLDRATMELERDFSLRIRGRETVLIGKIKEALERIENGTYGICEDCEEEISKERLKARPVATLCIECKRKQEAEEKARGL